MNESSDPPTIRIGTWNINWAKPGSIRGNIISDKLAATDCDVLCVTEGFAGIFPDRGHVIDAGPKWGFPIVEGRRKVLLWSKQRWTHVDSIGSEELPSGRFVAGVTQTSSGSPLTVVGVCIPWIGAHVRFGHKNRKPWQDHEAWLAGFERLRCRIPASRTVVLGDFNQTIPRTRAPKRVYEALLRAFEGFKIATAGELEGAPYLLIDHIAQTPDLTLSGIEIWPKRSAEDKFLSDHFGLWGSCGTC